MHKNLFLSMSSNNILWIIWYSCVLFQPDVWSNNPVSFSRPSRSKETTNKKVTLGLVSCSPRDQDLLHDHHLLLDALRGDVFATASHEHVGGQALAALDPHRMRLGHSGPGHYTLHHFSVH